VLLASPRAADSGLERCACAGVVEERTGCAQPRTQARKPIQRESAVAVRERGRSRCMRAPVTIVAGFRGGQRQDLPLETKGGAPSA